MNQAGIGALGGVFAVVFYLVLAYFWCCRRARKSQDVETKTGRAGVGSHRGDSNSVDLSSRNISRDLCAVVLLQRYGKDFYLELANNRNNSQLS
jgi:hypothetical protein